MILRNLYGAAYKCLNERGISGYGSLNGLADEAVPLCGYDKNTG